jgi:histidyl-tRNA synthetase
MAANISVQDFVRSATRTASHYGFSALDRLREDPACRECGERIPHRDTASDRRNDALHGMLTAGMCAYFDGKLNALPGPTLFYSIEQVPRSGEAAITFQVFNVKKSIAEALLIQTVRSLLNDLGYENHTLRINSLGDNDSVSRYVRDLTNFLRKRIDDMPAPARELMKEHPLTALMHLIEKEHELAKRSPNPLEYLTDMSRKHFREIIEFLDMSGMPFEIDSRLIGHPDCYSEALFAFDVRTNEGDAYPEPPLYIRGGRYNTFVAKMSRQKLPAAGAVVVLRDKRPATTLSIPRHKFSPAVFMIQLGFGPKIKSLLILDELKRAGIPVYQNVMSDSLTEQLRQAEAKRVRYAIILGQKEYVENNVILRDLHEQSQSYIPTASLADYLKRLTALV